ncbi:hypothetical protein FPSE_00703 [Fusarium pseudograminearum CS3096]|uniref:NACHT-NTPase and P-loop NTPases N-terminal domain-containing protein n=1 Tax=Fusarium pseudograminearum (strain CS3096) TaxID=1028729 RepID=K3VTE1_FUSPC|nr:hypothetical protein FPSE_00703 [Fusarium pseudograminearum CS3096]EKJ79102.1 hypothetical protein FPSE_00703 [Fusarium pseudograminearum CS3096]
MDIVILHNRIRDITATLKAAIEICKSATDAQSIPVPLQTLSSQIPWALAAFDKAREGIPTIDATSPDALALESIIKGCVKKSRSLRAYLRGVIPHAELSRLDRCRRFLGLGATVDMVVELKDGLFSDLKTLADNRAIEAEARENIKALVGFATGEPGFDLWGVPDSD